MPPEDNSDPGTLLDAAVSGNLEPTAGDPNAPAAPAPAPAQPTENAAPTADPNGAPTPTNQGDPAAPTATPTPDDWATIRARVAGEDDKVLARLSRYGTLDDYIKAGLEAQNKLGERVPNKAPGPDATDVEKAAYREANGIPATPTDYEIDLPGDLVLGEQDQPVADRFLEIAHKHNIPTAAANDIIAGQLAMQDEMIQAQEEADNTQRDATQALLTSPDMWGSETAANLNMINTLLGNSPPGTKEQIMGARLADGSLLGNNEGALRWLNAVAREVNPTATIVPSGGRSMLVSAKEEMAGLEKMMGDRSAKSEYWHGPTAAAKQARYLELVDYVAKTSPK